MLRSFITVLALLTACYIVSSFFWGYPDAGKKYFLQQTEIRKNRKIGTDYFPLVCKPEITGNIR